MYRGQSVVHIYFLHHTSESIFLQFIVTPSITHNTQYANVSSILYRIRNHRNSTFKMYTGNKQVKTAMR